MRYQINVTLRADQDTDNILQTTFLRWGNDAKNRYTQLIKRAYRILEFNPYAIGTKNIDEFPSSLRRFPLRNLNQNKSLNRVKNPPHVIYYRIYDPTHVEILRILHERMDIEEQLG